jgi:hypothetical protein
MRALLEEYYEGARRAWKDLIATQVGQLLDRTEPMPSALGIKVPNQEGVFAALRQFLESGDQYHGATVDGRNITTIFKVHPLGETSSLGPIRLIKILERRPGSHDTLGPDHLDVLIATLYEFGQLATDLKNLGLKAAVEQNEAHSWLSIRTAGFEFKLVHESVWAICCREMEAVAEGGCQ